MQTLLPFDEVSPAARPAHACGEVGHYVPIDRPARLSLPDLTDPPALPDPPDPPALIYVRHPRARRYIIRVADDGTVRVTVPRRGSRREAEAFAARERAWIEKQQRRAEAAREKRERERWLTANDGLETAIVQRAVRDRAKRELPPRLLELAAQHGLTVSRVSIRDQRWRWGSCSRSGHICLNWRLVEMPEAVRDYVLIHELMHLERMDHSPAFWKLVLAVCPEYKKARAWLRSQSAR